MTYQEVLWKNKFIWVVGILSKSGRMHRDLRQYVGRGGYCLGESKNGQLLVEFKGHTRCIPAGCVVEYGRHTSDWWFDWRTYWCYFGEGEMTETERQLDLLLGDALAENERLKRALKYQDDRENNWIGTHSPDCWSWGPKHYDCALRHIRGSND